MKRECFISAAVACVSLLVAAVFHRFFPGFGVLFKPLLWPLLVLPFCVRLRYALATAAIVPLLSAAVNGMPTFSAALTLSVAATAGLSLIAGIRRMSSWKFGACAAFAAAAFAASAAAEPIVLSPGETLVTNIASDVANDAGILLENRTAIVKEGAGTWSLHSGDFSRNRTATFQVRDGGVAYSASAARVETYPEPTAILAKALFHLDASATTTLKLKEGSETDVDVWTDVRETGDGSAENPYQYVRAVTNFQCSYTSPKLTTYLSKRCVDFAGLGSGVWMNWVKPDGTQATCGNLRNVFLVHGDTRASWGYMLGQRVGARPYFQTGGRLMWCTHNYENVPMHASRTYLNGREVDAFRTYYTSGTRCVVEVECLADSQSAQCFCNDRDMQITWPDGKTYTNSEGKKLNPFFNSTSQTGGGNRVGGGYVYEVILFTNQLSSAERMAVSDWLNQKWQGTFPPGACTPSFALSTNAVAKVSDGAPCSVTGDGTLEKTGSGTARLRAPLEPRANSQLGIRFAEGKMDLGYALPVPVSAGDTVDSSLTYLGPQLSAPAAGEDEGMLKKTGNGPLTLASVPSETRFLFVEGGTLTLSDPGKPSYGVVSPATNVVAATPAPGGTFSFEEFHEEYAESGKVSYDVANGQSKYGWHMIVPAMTSGKADSKAFFFDASYGKDKGQSWNLTIAAQDGVCSMGLKNNASAWTEVDFPEAGIYTFTVWVAGRSNQIGLPVKLLLGKDADSLVEFGTLVRTDGTLAYRKFTFQTPAVKAGRYQFWFKAPESGTSYYDKDICYQYDALSFVKSGTAPGVYKIPNGDFETRTKDITSFTLASTNAVVGYAVKQADNAGSVDESGTAGEMLGSANAYTTFNTYNSNDKAAHFNLSWNRADSTTQFYMSGNGSSLTTTFVPPAGTWRLRADVGVWQTTYNASDYYNVSAQVTVGSDAAVNLGTLELYGHKLAAETWPTVFATDGETPVTLVISGSVNTTHACKCGHALLDNLELVPSRRTLTNLVGNGGFEGTSTAWSFDVTPKPTGVLGSACLPYRQLADYYTYDFLEGANCGKLVNDDCIYRNVTIPNAGLYRLTANMMPRCNPTNVNFSLGKNPVLVYLAKGGVTNWLGRVEALQTTNFFERAYTFRIPEGGEGTYSLGFKGQSVWGGEGQASVDQTMLIDVVSLYEIETGGSLALPEDLTLNVKLGAKLVLDFDGTNRISRLRVNGRGYRGVISAETHPELFGLGGPLSGRGALEAFSKGCLLLVR